MAPSTASEMVASVMTGEMATSEAVGGMVSSVRTSGTKEEGMGLKLDLLQKRK